MTASDVTIEKPFRHFDRRQGIDAKFAPGQERRFVRSRPTPAEVERLMRRGYLSGGLPDDFPGRAALVAAGHHTTSDVAALDRAALLKIKGIGEVTADAILSQR